MFSLSSRPTAPSLLVPFESHLYALPVRQLSFHTTCTLHTATTIVTAVFVNIAAYTADTLFLLPLPSPSSLVTHCTASVGDRAVHTALLGVEEAEAMQRRLQQAGKTRTETATAGSAKDRRAAEAAGREGSLPPLCCEGSVPELFRLPISSVSSGAEVRISCRYVETMRCVLGAYHLRLPLRLEGDLIDKGRAMDDVLSVTCVLHGLEGREGTAGSGGSGGGSVSGSTLRYESASHDLVLVSHDPNRIEIEVRSFDNKQAAAAEQQTARLTDGDEDGSHAQAGPVHFPSASADFELVYTFASDSVLSTLVSFPSASSPGSVSFLLYLHPPAVDHVRSFFSRNLVFMVEQSQPMTASRSGALSIFHSLCAAISAAMSNLKPADSFAVLSFSRSAVSSYPTEAYLAPASPTSIAYAGAWLRNQRAVSSSASRTRRASLSPSRPPAAGVREALQSGLKILESRCDAYSLSYLVLVVAGNEGDDESQRALLSWLEAELRDRPEVRLLVLGVGRCVNWHFVRELARIGRGLCDIALYADRVYGALLDLVSAAAVPVIVDLSVRLHDRGSSKKKSKKTTAAADNADGLPAAAAAAAVSTSANVSLEYGPVPLPDLHLNAPVCITGRWDSAGGPFPSMFLLSGTQADKSIWTAKVHAVTSHQDHSSCGLQDRLELLSCQAWRQQSRELTNRLITTSKDEGMVTAQTTLVAYEGTKPHAVKELEREVHGQFLILDRGRYQAGEFPNAAVRDVMMDSEELQHSSCCGDWDCVECLQC